MAGDNLSPFNNVYLVCQRLQTFLRMRSQHNQCSSFPFLLYNVTYQRHTILIKSICGFIQQEHIWRFKYGAGDAQPLFHAKGIFAIFPLILWVESHSGNALSYTGMVSAAIQRCDKRQIFHTCIVGKKSWVFQKQTYGRRKINVPPQHLSIYIYLPFCWTDEPSH